MAQSWPKAGHSWPQLPIKIGSRAKELNPKMKPKAWFVLIFIAFSVMGVRPIFNKTSIKKRRRDRIYCKKQHKSNLFGPMLGTASYSSRKPRQPIGSQFKQKSDLSLIFTIYSVMSMWHIFNKKTMKKGCPNRIYCKKHIKQAFLAPSWPQLPTKIGSRGHSAPKPLVFTVVQWPTQLGSRAGVFKNIVFVQQSECVPQKILISRKRAVTNKIGSRKSFRLLRNQRKQAAR